MTSKRDDSDDEETIENLQFKIILLGDGAVGTIAIIIIFDNIIIIIII